MAGMKNSSMGPSWGIDPMTTEKMLYHGHMSHSGVGTLHLAILDESEKI